MSLIYRLLNLSKKMTKRPLKFIVVMSFFFVLPINGYSADCSVNRQGSHAPVLQQSLAIGTQLSIELPQGESTLLLSCDSTEVGVFSFSHTSISQHALQIDGMSILPLTTNQISYHTPASSFLARLNINKEIPGKVILKWSSLNAFIEYNQKNAFVVSLFFGVTVALAVYVLILGRNLKERRFYYYSFYMFSVTIFFMLQEGQLNLFLANSFGQNKIVTQMFFAGLTVFLGARFLIRQLDLDKLWPKLSLYLLQLPANIVLLLSFIIWVVDIPWLIKISAVISYATLYIITGNVFLIGLAAKRKVPTANIVFLAIIILLVAMVIRVAIPDMNIFIRKYVLFFSITLESLLLAMATSETIKQISYQGKQAQKEAITDELCNIYNRRGWIQQAEKILAQHQEYGGYFVVFYIDLNKFKQINDRYGHHVGDEVLMAISMLITHQVKRSDPVGRIGGDEFVVISYFKNKKNSGYILDRLKQKLERTLIQCSAGEIEITSSVGIQIYSEPPEGIDQVLKEADQIMYEHKLAFD